MRAIAACQFTLKRFEAWRLTVVVFTTGVVLLLMLWFIVRPVPWPPAGAAALAMLALAAVGVGGSLLRTPAVSLRWDGQAWHAGPAASMGQEPESGVLSVEVDLGSWMLLRFVPHGSGWRSRAIWLPVQRRGIELQWHGLRCAVYSPRPASGTARGTAGAGDL